MLAKKNKNKSPHKYLAMKKLLLFPVFLFFFFGCSHHQDFEQQEEKSIYEKTIGVSNGFCFFSKEQKPREAYTNNEGESRFERQMLNCLSYQIDGHLETIAGTILYISSMPQSFFGDLITCGNEIYDGMWNHVN